MGDSWFESGKGAAASALCGVREEQNGLNVAVQTVEGGGGGAGQAFYIMLMRSRSSPVSSAKARCR